MKNRLTILGLGFASLTTACSGGNGDVNGDGRQAALLGFEGEAAGDNCKSGGTRVNAGFDENDNGTLDAQEIKSTSYVCSGAVGDSGSPGESGDPGTEGEPGAEGEPGEDGDDGAPLLVTTSDEAPGDNCTFGGTRVDAGLDADGSEALEAEEISATSYLCDGAPGTAGVAGFRLVAKYTAPGGPIAEIISPSPDGKTLVYTSSDTKTIGFVNITNPAQPVLLGTTNLAATTGGDGEPTSVAFSPDGQHVVAVVKDTGDQVNNADAGALVIINATTRAIVGQVAVGVGPDSIHLTPDGTKAVVAIEDEENPDGNNQAQARPGSIQVVTLDYATPSNSVVVTIPVTPPFGNTPTDPQPEYVDITQDGKTAIVSVQEANLFAVVDLTTNEITSYIDAGNSVHSRSDKLNDKRWIFNEAYEGQAQPDGTCILPDQAHFISANEGDTSNGNFGGVFAGGRGFSIFDFDGNRTYDSADAAEWAAFRAGAYPDSRSANRGMEPEGCGAGTFGGRPFAFITGERNSSVLVVDVSQPSSPVIVQVLGGPNRPESAVAIESRNLFAVGGEGNGTTAGGGIWIYEAVSDLGDAGHGAHVYSAHSSGTAFGALSALAYQESSGFLLGIPDNAYADSRIWSFAVNHAGRRVDVVDELLLKDASGAQLSGYDPEGLVVNPEGGFIVASEGLGANGGGGGTCTGSVSSNRVLFFSAAGQLDTAYGGGDGIVDLPCGLEANAFNWTNMGSNGFEGVSVIDSLPGSTGGLKVYVAFQRPLTGEGSNARIGVYDVDTASWGFYYYPLDADVGGVSGNTFLSELIHVSGDTFAVIERDQGYAAGALNKTVRVFSLATGTLNNPTNPVEKSTAIDLLADSFRFDQEKLEGLALGGGSLFVVNDNDGGQALNFFARFSPQRLGTAPVAAPEVIPTLVINEVNSNGAQADFVELKNVGATPVNVAGLTLVNQGGGVHTLGSVDVAAGGLLLVQAGLAFGLGSDDSVELKTALGTRVDFFDYGAHVASASRCSTTGLVFWPTTGLLGSATATPGAENVCTGPTVAGQTDIVINEAFSNGTDFVELYNVGAGPVDLSNWKFRDNDITHSYVVPAGTILAAGEYYVIEQPAFDFGLGAQDSAIVLSPYNQQVDKQDWTVHANTASRCPNGTGTLTSGTANTKGAANICP